MRTRSRQLPADAKPHADAAQGGPDAEGRSKRAKTAHQGSSDHQVNSFLAQWLWKREAKSDAEKFHQPYEYPLEDGGTLVVQQSPFTAEVRWSLLSRVVELTCVVTRSFTQGFASTVWDSAIVLSKYLETRHGAALRGKSAVELGAGCGLLSLVLCHLGARVVATDLECNLPLLRRNVADACTTGKKGTACVHALTWSTRSAASVRRDVNAGAAFDVVVASDVMYLIDAVPDLVRTLVAVSDPRTVVYMAYGRNRSAEDAFMRAAKAAGFSVADVPDSELHATYQCLDVTVLRLRLQPGGG